MSENADQKPKWREWWIISDENSNLTILYNTGEIRPEPGIQVIEAAPALAEIERLRAENAILRDELIHTSGNLRLLGLSGMAAKINEALTHYEQFKKESAK